MTWEPTHVQFTVLRAKSLVGKLKGKSSAKVTDVFVSIALGKEKFQTSTIKYGGKVPNSVEWFEECDLYTQKKKPQGIEWEKVERHYFPVQIKSIPNMKMEIEVSVMNRGLLSDEFVGYVAVPLREYDVYERPRSHWLPLQHKPSKLPDGRYRGEIEVRLTFHVKSRENETSPGNLKENRSGSIKSLVSSVGDKFKFARRSLRGESNQTFSTPQPRKPNKKASTKTSSYMGDITPSLNAPVQFDAVDLFVPEQCWRENEFDNESLTAEVSVLDTNKTISRPEGEFVRSYSLTSDKRKSRDFKSRSLMNLPSDYSLTLPNMRRNKHRPSLDESAFMHHSTSSRSSRGSVTSQEGYLENMFRKENEVEERISDAFNEEVEEEYDEDEDEDHRPRRKKSAQFDVFATSSQSESSGSSESETESPTDEEQEEEESPVILPKVKLKSNSVSQVDSIHAGDENVSEKLEEKTVNINKSSSSALLEGRRKSVDLESDMPEGSVYHSAGSTLDVNQSEITGVPVSVLPSNHVNELDRVIAREQSRKKSNSLNSQGSSDNVTSSRASSSSLSYQGITAAQRAFERDSPESEIDMGRRKITLEEQFNFTGASQISNDEMKSVQRRKVKQYTKGGRRYTVQGFENHRSAPDIREHRPSFLAREDSVPEDLIAVYRNMNREELIRLVVTHKAQLIRKDQYINDLEKYIDQLLVRVMETSPRLLQNL